MVSDKVRDFVSQNHHAVLTTFRGNGAAQMSIVSVGPYGGGVAFTTTAGRAKLGNLQRDSRCSLLVSKEDWWGFLVLEGHARVMSAGNTDAGELSVALRDVYRAVAGMEHPDWEEYDEAMWHDRRSAVVVVAEHTYGTAF
jgi:PPOX class probable F420-dependent enzyme